MVSPYNINYCTMVRFRKGAINLTLIFFFLIHQIGRSHHVESGQNMQAASVQGTDVCSSQFTKPAFAYSRKSLEKWQKVGGLSI